MCLTNEPIEALAGAIKANSTLQELNIARNGISTFDIELLSNVFAFNATLSKLTFTLDWSTKQTVTLDATATEADFSGTPFQVHGAMILAAFLPRCRALTTLGMSNCHLGIEGSRHVVNALGINNTLLALDLSDNQMSTGNIWLGDQRAVEALAGAIKANSTLLELNVAKNGINSSDWSLSGL